jgi:hypothetical protein
MWRRFRQGQADVHDVGSSRVASRNGGTSATTIGPTAASAARPPSNASARRPPQQRPPGKRSTSVLQS